MTTVYTALAGALEVITFHPSSHYRLYTCIDGVASNLRVFFPIILDPLSGLPLEPYRWLSYTAFSTWKVYKFPVIVGHTTAGGNSACRECTTSRTLPTGSTTAGVCGVPRSSLRRNGRTHPPGHSRYPARAVYTDVLSDTYTLHRRSYESFPVLVESYGCWRGGALPH